MNLFLAGIIIFVIIYLFLNWFAKTSSKKNCSIFEKISNNFIHFLSYNSCCWKYLFSIPFLLILLSGLKIKGLTALQMFQLWRLIQYIRNSGKFSQNQFRSSRSGSSSITLEEAYKLLGLKKGCSKEEVLNSAAKLQKKIHPDMNRDVNTERLSQIVNEAKEKF